MKRLALGLCVLLAASAAHAEVVVLRGTIYQGGKAVEGGVVLDGAKIVRVGPWATLRVPSGAKVVAPVGAHITAGLIDAHSTAGVTNESSWAEHGSEVVPHLRVLDVVDLDAPAWARLARRGVTTVYVTPGPGSVVGSQGAVIKTAGPMAGRVLVEGGAVKATLGSEAWVRGVRNRRPSRRGAPGFQTRRPNTLMGAVWVFREAFSLAARGKLEAPAGPVLRQILAGKRVLRIQARTRGEIETALRLTRERGISFVLEEATEAYYLVDMLAAAKVPVIFGPIAEQPRGYRAKAGGANDPCLGTPALLSERGVSFCLTANDRVDEDGTWAQGMLAVRYGLSMVKAVEALTSSPADILGGTVAKRIGRLEAGRDADVVLWSGEPFEATTRAIAVFVDGELVAGALPKGAGAAPPKQRFK